MCRSASPVPIAEKASLRDDSDLLHRTLDLLVLQWFTPGVRDAGIAGVRPIGPVGQRRTFDAYWPRQHWDGLEADSAVPLTILHLATRVARVQERLPGGLPVTDRSGNGRSGSIWAAARPRRHMAQPHRSLRFCFGSITHRKSCSSARSLPRCTPMNLGRRWCPRSMPYGSSRTSPNNGATPRLR